MDLKLHRFGGWCAAGYLFALIVGWIIIAGFLPPPSPTQPPSRIAEIFQQDTLRIRIGMLFVMLAALLMIPVTASIVRMLTKIEGRVAMLSYSALLGGVGTMVLTFYPAIWWLWAAYRPDRAGELTLLINDLAWMQFIGGISMFMAAPLAIAFGGLADNRPDPIIPRWAAYANIFVCVLIIPDQLLFFFHTGPFTWAGLFGFYLPLSSFIAWFVIINYVVLRSANQVVEEAATPTPTAMAA
jgi:hypothetical protein